MMANIGLILVIVISVVFAFYAFILSVEQKREIKKQEKAWKEEAKRKEKLKAAAEEYINETEQMETGNAAADFDAGLDLLHQHAQKRK